MFAKSLAKAALLSVPLMLGVTPALANDARMPSFWSLDYHYGAEGGVEAARREIGERIPAGTPLDAARALLRHAGARCETRPDAMQCSYDETHAVDDAIQDASWTIDVAAADGRVSAVTIDRQP